MMADIAYRRLQEAWVSGNTGTTWSEICVVLSQLPLSVFLACVLCRKQSFLRDFVIIVIPAIFSATDIFQDVRLIPLGLLALCLFYLFFVEPISLSKLKRARSEYPGTTWLTNFRACNYLGTAINILAVDFTIYPRRFAKTETFGTGLMDLGVGAFMMINGFSRKPSNSQAFKGVLVLVALGGLRLLSTQSVDYQQHVTEYGLHCNFFFILAFCRAIALILDNISPVGPIWLALITSSGHQAALNSGLQDWALGWGSRDNFLTANREGLASAWGYVALYYYAAAFGRWLMSAKSRSTLMARLTLLCTVAWLAFFAWSQNYGVSRRLCNVGYIAWILATGFSFSLQLTIVELLISACSMKSVTPRLIVAINNSGLFFFLIANLLTGFLNMNMQTLLLSPLASYSVLITYGFTISYIMHWLLVRDIRIKFW